MRLLTPARSRPERPPRSKEPEPVRRRRTNRGEHGSTSSLELMALTPMLALGVLFILWAGRSARAELVTSLAAQEAAVAAALCCNDGPTNGPSDGESGESTRSELRRELMAEAVLGARSGLDYLCLGDPRPAPGRAGFVTATAADLTAGQSTTGTAQQVLVVTTHVTCQTDGAAAPVRGLFGTRTLHGHGAHVAVLTQVPTPDGKTPDNPDGKTPDDEGEAS